MRQYLDLVHDVLHNGIKKPNRTGVDTLSVFGRQMRFDLRDGFPLVTTKKIHLKSVIYELLWFLRGDTNIRWLNEHGVTIWNEWADESGELGPVYGYQWRKWQKPVLVPERPGIHYEMDDEHIELRPFDQIVWVINEIKKNPDSRRLIVSAWNVSDIDKMALSPCHLLFQFNTRKLAFNERAELYHRLHGEDADYLVSLTNFLRRYDFAHPDEAFDVEGIPKYALDCQMYQRSCDLFLGVPFNIASYSLLTMMVAQVTGCIPGEFIWVGGDVHLYLNHLEQARLQLTREPNSLPRICMNEKVRSIDEFQYEDFTLEGYDPHPIIKASIAV